MGHFSLVWVSFDGSGKREDLQIRLALNEAVVNLKESRLKAACAVAQTAYAFIPAGDQRVAFVERARVVDAEPDFGCSGIHTERIVAQQSNSRTDYAARVRGRLNTACAGWSRGALGILLAKRTLLFALGGEGSEDKLVTIIGGIVRNAGFESPA